MAISYRHESIEIINLVKLANKNNISLNSFALSTESAALWVSYNLVQIYFILPSRRQLHNGHYTALRGMKMISFDFHIVPKFKWWKILKKIISPRNEFYSFHYFTITSLLDTAVVWKIRKLHFT